jgi:biopolymer transport protein ExbD
MTATSPGKWEPNLVPMLDMVLQMVMFFMLCANFAQEELSERVKLPAAVEARALDKFTDRVIFVNLLIVSDEKTKARTWKALIQQDEETNALRVQRNMENRLTIYRAGLKPAEWDKGKAPLVVLRADKECDWKMVYDVMAACKRAGYADVQLRVHKVAGVP